jgi:hypothetical protein
MRRFPLNAQVPFQGQLATIISRTGDSITTIYMLHARTATGR